MRWMKGGVAVGIAFGVSACGFEEGGNDLTGSDAETPSLTITVTDADPNKYASFDEVMNAYESWDRSFPVRIIRKNTRGEVVAEDVLRSFADMQALSRPREQVYAGLSDSDLLATKKLFEGVPDSDPDKEKLLTIVNREAKKRGLIK